MTNQPTTPDPNLPPAGQTASTDGVAQPVPGTQAPDTLIGGPMPQPPADPKKKNTGLLIGGLLAIGIAIAILVGLVLSGASLEARGTFVGSRTQCVASWLHWGSAPPCRVGTSCCGVPTFLCSLSGF